MLVASESKLAFIVEISHLGNVWREVFNVQGVQFDYFSFESTLVSTSELVSSSNSNSAKTESLGKNSKRCC